MATSRLRVPRVRWGRAARPGRRGALAGLLALALGSAAVVGVATGTAARADSPCATLGTKVTCTYSWTGGTQTFTVPAGVTALHVTAVGAAGGNSAQPPR